MLSGGETAADYGGLDRDGEDDFDGVDIGAGEEGGEVGGGGAVVGVESCIWARFEGFGVENGGCGGGAGVDGFDVGVGGDQGGEVF